MTRKLPPLNAVRAFEVAARHVSFTKAAEELHVTHGAVSRQVALLESWLGMALFRRAASQLALTEAGRAYAAELTSLFDRLAVSSLHLMQQAAPTKLRVNAPPTFTMRWLIARLMSFQRMRPEVEIQMTTSLAPVNFHENSYDIAIRGAQEPLAGCQSTPFMTELIVPICHVDLQESGRLTKPADLRAQTLISYDTEPFAWSTWLEMAGSPQLKGAGAIRFEQMYFALQAAAEGLGVVLVPLFLVLDDIIGGRLCAPFGLLAAMRRKYFVNSVDSARKNGATDVFREWLMREGRDTEASIDAWAASMDWTSDASA